MCFAHFFWLSSPGNTAFIKYQANMQFFVCQPPQISQIFSTQPNRTPVSVFRDIIEIICGMRLPLI